MKPPSDSLLEEVDPIISAFARRHSLSVVKNERESVGRSMQWGENPYALLQIYRTDLVQPTWNMWACCWEDREGKRYMKSEDLFDHLKVSNFVEDLDDLLENGFRLINDWRRNTSILKFATKLSPLPRF